MPARTGLKIFVAGWLGLVGAQEDRPPVQLQTTRPQPTAASHLEVSELTTPSPGIRPLVIVLHGRGAGLEQIRSFRRFGADARVVAIHAPYRLDTGAAWLTVRSRHQDSRRVAAELSAQADQVRDTIFFLQRHYPTRGRPIIAGYSQGGMVALALAAQHPDAVERVFTASSFVPDDLLTVAPDRRHVPEIVLYHGRQDRRVPLRRARRSLRSLREAGFDARLEVEPRAHAMRSRDWARLRREIARDL